MTNCPLCQAESGRLRFFAEYRGETTDLYRCLSCATEFLHPQPSTEWLNHEYAAYFERREGKLKPTSTLGPKRTYFEALFSALASAGSLTAMPREILEIGSAEGESLRVMNGLWPEARLTAVEILSSPTQYADVRNCTHFNMSVEDFLAKSPTTQLYDAIFLFDVMEHLRAPVTAIGNLAARYLRHGGAMVATFPCVDAGRGGGKGLVWDLAGRLWPQYKSEHLFYFSSGGIAALERAAGLERRSYAALEKILPIGYLLNIGSSFGPRFTQNLTRAAARLVPSAARRHNLRYGFGEALWVARKA